MRTDSTHHLLAAARQRSDKARQQVEEALKQLDQTTHAATVSDSPGQRACHAPGFTPSRTCWSSSSSGPDRAENPQPRRLFGRPRHPCTDGFSLPTNASGS